MVVLNFMNAKEEKQVLDMCYLMGFGFLSNKDLNLNTVPFNILLRSLEKMDRYMTYCFPF